MADDRLESLINRDAVKKEFTETILEGERLFKVLIDTADAATKLNAVLGKANGVADFNTKAKATTDSINAIGKAQDQAIQKYYANQQKQEAAAALGYAKEVDAAKKQADKLIQIENDKQAQLAAAKAKRASQIGPTISGGSGTDRELTEAEARAIDIKAEAERQERIAAAGATQQEAAKATETVRATTAVREETAALSASQKIINQTTGSLQQNIAQQVKLQAELKGVQTQLKNGTGDTAKLTQQEVLLKTAIQQNSTVIRQQAKDQQAANTSAEGLNAKLALLRTSYNQLTAAERNNSEIGGVLLKEIKELDAQTKKIAEDQGLYNKSVGDYENKIKSAISSYVPYGRQLIQGVDALKTATGASEAYTSGIGKLGFAFAGFTIAGFAVAIASASFYLSQFQGTADKVDIALAGLKGRFGQLGKDVVDSVLPDAKSQTVQQKFNKSAFNFIGNLAKSIVGGGLFGQLAQQVKTSTDATAASAENAKRLEKNFEDLNTITDITVKKQQGLAQQIRADAKNVLYTIDERIAKLEIAEKVEQGVIDLQKTRGEAAVKLGIQVGNIYNTIDKGQQAQLQKGDIQLATSLFRQSKFTKEGYEIYKAGLEQRIDTLNQSTLLEERIRNDHARLEVKQDKLDADNAKKALAERKRVLQENLQEALKIEQETLISDSATLDEREQAVSDYESRVLKLINKGLKERTINQKEAGLIILDTENKIGQQTQKIEADTQAALKKIFQDGYKQQLDLERLQIDDIKDLQNQALLDADKTRADDLASQANLYAKGKINAGQYAQAIYDIEQKASGRRIEVQIGAIEKVIAKQKEYLEFGIGTDKELQQSENELTKLQIQLSELRTKKQIDDLHRLDEERKKLHEKEKELADASIELIKTIGDASFESAKAKIDEQSTALDKQADLDKKAVERSLLTDKQKADKTALIDAKLQANKEELAKRQRVLDREKAEFDKAIAIAKIIEGTAIGVAQALPNLILAGLVAAIGAVELATVIAQPLPAFAEGTENHPGGWSLFGEAGTERVTEPGKKPYLTDGATIGYLPTGTRIESNSDLMKAMAWPNKSTASDNQLNLSALMQQNDRHTARLEKALQVKQAANYQIGRRDGAKFSEYLRRNIN